MIRDGQISSKFDLCLTWEPSPRPTGRSPKLFSCAEAAGGFLPAASHFSGLLVLQTLIRSAADHGRAAERDK